MNKNNLFLVGPMGSGKSTIGRQLAARLDKSFYDSDKELELHTGVSISWIFEMEGERGFRQRETKVIDELSSMHNIVLATGGGAVLSEQNQAYLSQRGLVIYLSATAEQLYKRIAKDTKRPLLQTGDRRQTITDLLNERDAIYRQLADIVVRTGEGSVQHTVNTILNKLKKSVK